MDLLKPLVTLHLETTSNDRDTARIVEIALYKVFDLNRSSSEPGNYEVIHRYVDPQTTISERSVLIHGLTNELLRQKGARPFGEIGEGLITFLDGCDLLGYNIDYFDSVVLANECTRACIDWNSTAHRLIDACRIFKIMNPRSLAAAASYYLNQTDIGMQSARHDALSTLDVFQAQLAEHPQLPQDLAQLERFCNRGRGRVDLAGRFYQDSQDVVRFGFGPHKDQPALNHPHYLDWMWQGTFPDDTMQAVQQLRADYRALHQLTEDFSNL